jgi:hypothetical protein
MNKLVIFELNFEACWFRQEESTAGKQKKIIQHILFKFLFLCIYH